MAESERFLPQFVSMMEGAMEEAGLAQESIVMRMTGCPNGCARPWIAEYFSHTEFVSIRLLIFLRIGMVGKSYGITRP